MLVGDIIIRISMIITFISKSDEGYRSIYLPPGYTPVKNGQEPNQFMNLL